VVRISYFQIDYDGSLNRKNIFLRRRRKSKGKRGKEFQLETRCHSLVIAQLRIRVDLFARKKKKKFLSKYVFFL
jgi:hypothetical protein